MRFTNSNDGRLRATMKISYRIGRTQLVKGVLAEYRWADGFDPETDEARKEIAKLTRTGIERIVRTQYSMYGTEVWTRLEGVDEAVVQAVERQVDVMFPELIERSRG
jgi:hypothetical protein